MQNLANIPPGAYALGEQLTLRPTFSEEEPRLLVERISYQQARESGWLDRRNSLEGLSREALEAESKKSQYAKRVYASGIQALLKLDPLRQEPLNTTFIHAYVSIPREGKGNLNLSHTFAWIAPINSDTVDSSAPLVMQQDPILMEETKEEIIYSLHEALNSPKISPEFLRSIARVRYLEAHLMAYNRGSAAIQEGMEASYFLAKGVRIYPAIGQQMDVRGLTSPSLEHFQEYYCKIWAGSLPSSENRWCALL